MTSLLADAPLTQLLPTLWKCRPASADEVMVGVSVPHTVIYEHNFPKGLFHTTADGFLQRRIGKDIDSKTVVDVFSSVGGGRAESGAGAPSTSSVKAEHHPQRQRQQQKKSAAARGDSSPQRQRRARQRLADRDGIGDPRKSAYTPGGTLDIVAVYVENRTDSVEFAVQFLTDAGLRAFLLGSTAQGRAASTSAMSTNPLGGGAGLGQRGRDPELVAAEERATADIRLVQHKNGILQKFIYPVSVHNELIQVIWTSHMCIAEKLRANAFLGDTSLTPFQRAATFQAPPAFTTRAYVAPHIGEQIRRQCESLVDQIYIVEHKLVEQLTLYFKVDVREKLWLLWCSSIRFTPGPLKPRPVASLFSKNPQSGRGGGAASPKPGILPEFVLPATFDVTARPHSRHESGRRSRSCRGDGGGGDSGAGVFNITTAAMYAALHEEAVLQLPEPSISMRCLDERPASGSVALPTQSRLCRKMRWLRGPLTLSRASPLSSISSSLSLSSSAAAASAGRRRNMTGPHGGRAGEREGGMPSNIGNSARRSPPPTHPTRSERHRRARHETASHEQQSSAGPTRTTPPSAHFTLGGLPLKTTAPSVEAEVNVEYTMADYDALVQKRVLAGGASATTRTTTTEKPHVEEGFSSRHCQDSVVLHGNYTAEMSMVLQLTRAPVPGAICGDRRRASAMNVVKRGIEFALEFLQLLRDTCYSHFLLFAEGDEPLPFSVPRERFNGAGEEEEEGGAGGDAVYSCVLSFLDSCGFERVSVRDAVVQDLTVGRCGAIDDLSHHHNHHHHDTAADDDGAGGQNGGLRPGDPACFFCRTTRQANTLSARLSPFMVVDLRTLHDHVQRALLAT